MRHQYSARLVAVRCSTIAPLGPIRTQRAGGVLADSPRPFFFMVPPVRRFQLLKTRPAVERYFLDQLHRSLPRSYRIRSQAPIGPYYADFLVRRSKRARVLIEIDGGYHTQYAQHLRDIQKTELFLSWNYSVWRMTPEYAYQVSPDEIRRVIHELCQSVNTYWMTARELETSTDPSEEFQRRAGEERFVNPSRGGPHG